ncbi:hypothetical protein ARMGADRAFT_1075157 [Armillaria gallica]|uniref:Uncharacterized protein n=1 Tax=Armillaria gallica TaxID=47427 RepID=A0A2H3EAA1_ARMGA|nr:hypothetical protein ARMGADRAFT_1075157 [Armillaria gallica]
MPAPIGTRPPLPPLDLQLRRANQTETYGLQETPGMEQMINGSSQTQTTQVLSSGWRRTFFQSSKSGIFWWNTYDQPPMNHLTNQSRTQFPPTGFSWPKNFPEPRTDHYDQRRGIPSPFPLHSDTMPPDLIARLEYQSQNLHGFLHGPTRVATPAPTVTLDPLEEEKDFQTLTPTPIHSPTPSLSDPMMTPSTQEASTMSGLNLGMSTGKYLAPTEPPSGNSDDKISNTTYSGPMLANPRSTWTSTSPSTAEIPSSGNRLTPAWPQGYTPTSPGAWHYQPQETGYPMHEPIPPQNRYPSRQTYVPSQYYTSGLLNRDFEFQFDKETFGEAIWNAGGDTSLY